MSLRDIVIEACVNSVHSAIEAQKSGASRVELCDNLHDGGTTPSAGAIEAARERLDIELNVIIRPRGGDFHYTGLELAIMKADLRRAKALGADGVVFGMPHTDGTVNMEQTAQLVELARPMSTTFHRAFDMSVDPFAALEALLQLGIDRVLSSGQRPSAMAGIELLARLVDAAGDRIVVMPGVGIDSANINELIKRTRAREYHVLAQKPVASKMVFRNERAFMGSDPELPEYEVLLTDAVAIQAICRAARDGS
jgi:copper homeostasis protein